MQRNATHCCALGGVTLMRVSPNDRNAVPARRAHRPVFVRELEHLHHTQHFVHTAAHGRDMHNGGMDGTGAVDDKHATPASLPSSIKTP